MTENIVVTLKYLNNFGGTPEAPLINCEINLILTWSENCVMSSTIKKAKFAITVQNFISEL